MVHSINAESSTVFSDEFPRLSFGPVYILESLTGFSV